MNKYFILVGNDGFVTSRAINISGSRQRMIPVNREIFDSLNKDVLTAYFYNGERFVLDETRVEQLLHPAPALSELDEVRLALAELAELVTGGA